MSEAPLLMSIDFSQPPLYLRLISSDEITYHYPREKLVRSCRFFSDLLSDFGEKLTEVKVELTGSQVNLFLNFLEADRIPSSIDDIICLVEACDYFDLQYTGPSLRDRRELVNHAWGLIIYQSELKAQLPKGARDGQTMIDQFLSSKDLNRGEWRGIHYTLTHLEDLIAYSKVYLVNAYKKSSERALRNLVPLIPDESQWIGILTRIKESVNLDQPDPGTYGQLREQIKSIPDSAFEGFSAFRDYFIELGLL